MENLDQLIELAIKEDIKNGDITSQACVPPEKKGEAIIKAKESLLIVGLGVAANVLNQIDASAEFSAEKKDGEWVRESEVVARISGSLRSLLRAERIMLNFLQRLSGIASITKQYVEAISESNAWILDTRKTHPGFRALEKYAVKMGGGKNHRMNLSDRYLIKENHITACGDLQTAIETCKMDRGQKDILIEVETTNLDEVKSAIQAGADIIMFDNFSVEQCQEAVGIVAGKCKTEASGNLNLSTIKSYAQTGVDYLSVGAITHSAKSSDLSMIFL